MTNFLVKIATQEDRKHAETICLEIAENAKARGTGIAKRSQEYIEQKIYEGKAIIAIHKSTQQVAGFCYIESWEHNEYVANSGLIVFHAYRNLGLAKKIKEMAFKLSRNTFPNAKLFGLTTGLAVMKINSDLGYTPVTFSELTQDDAFWSGCQKCVNYEILVSKEYKNCLCTGMLYSPEAKKPSTWDYIRNLRLLKGLKKN